MNSDKQLQPAGDGDLERQRVEVLMRIGAIRAADAISASLGSQTIRGLQQIRDQKLYIALGYERFDDFLQSERSPMNYAKFNRLEKLIESEGDELFDFLSAIDAPLSKRKLLGKGDLSVEGKEVVAQVGDDEIRVPVNNTKALLAVLTRVVDQRNEQARKIERGEKQLKSLKLKLEEAKNGNGNGNGKGDFFDALLSVCGSLSMLATEAEKLSDEEREQQRKAVYDTIGEQMRRVDEALGLKVPDSVRKAGKAVRAAAHLVDDDS